MPLSLFTLANKKQLTHDVFLLSFETPTSSPAKYGQFITFLLKAGGRAYSILNQELNRFEFIIKRVENGRG
jgi:ferredoxin-NADP reductase